MVDGNEMAAAIEAAKIAKANGITSYTGKSEQNISMLKLLKSGKLIKA